MQAEADAKSVRPTVPCDDEDQVAMRHAMVAWRVPSADQTSEEGFLLGAQYAIPASGYRTDAGRQPG